MELGVLSHAHYDHADGMAAFFARNAHAPFYLRAGSAENCYGKRWIFHKYIGICRILQHEQSLIFHTEKGLAIFSSCSHAGADHIIEEVQEAYPKENICAMAGGFHLYRTSPEDIRALARKLRKAGIGNIYTGHCTGSEAFEILRDELGEQAVQIYTGMEIVI